MKLTMQDNRIGDAVKTKTWLRFFGARSKAFRLEDRRNALQTK
jgi:hypothetical protein